MDEAMLDSEKAMQTFLSLVAAEPDIARVPVMVDSSKWSVIEAGLKSVSGKPIVNSISMKEGEEAFLSSAPKGIAYSAAGVGMGFDTTGPAGTQESQVQSLKHTFHLPARTARSLRGCDLGSARRRDRPPDHARREISRHRRGCRETGRGMAQLGRAQAARTCPGEGYRSLRGRGYGGSPPSAQAPDRGDRR